MLKWKAEALEKLMNYHARKQSLRSLELELKRLELTATCSTAPDRGEQSLNHIVTRAELSRARSEAKLWVDATENALAGLTAEEQLILEKLCIQPRRGNVCRLIKQTGLARSTLYRKRDEALRKFAVAMYGKC